MRMFEGPGYSHVMVVGLEFSATSNEIYGSRYARMSNRRRGNDGGDFIYYK